MYAQYLTAGPLLFYAFAAAGMDSLFYADGAFFERLYKRFKDGGQAANKTRMVRRALFIHQ